MGHPLQLGPYAGLRPLGLAVGPSRFRPGADNPSSLTAAAVSLQLDPLRSLLERAWVLQITVRDAQVQLRANSRGAYWALGPMAPGREPPRLGLVIRLQNPARVLLHPARGGSLPLRLSGDARLQLHRRDLSMAAEVQPQAGGSLRLGLQANWQQRRWLLHLAPRRLPLQPLVPLLPAAAQGQLAGRLTGTLDGRLQLRSGPSCRGRLQASQARWRSAFLPAPLTAERLVLRCGDGGLRLDPAALASGPWRGRLAGALSLAAARPVAIDLQLQARQTRLGHRLQARLQGPWRTPTVQLQGSVQGPQLPQQPPLPVLLDGRLALRFLGPAQVRLQQLRLRRGDSALTLAGTLWPRLALRSQAMQLGPQLLRPLQPLLGRTPRLQADLQVAGSFAEPQVLATVRQPANPLFGPVAAALRWRPGLLRLERFTAPALTASGQLPLPAGRGGGLQAGPLQLDVDLRGYPLARLSPLIASPLRGELDAWGRLQGPLQALRPDLRLLVRDPGVGPLQLLERWQGSLQGSDLELQPLAPAPPGQLQARLDRRWLPAEIRLQRSGGLLELVGDPRAYRWRAQGLPLAGLGLRLGPQGGWQPLRGLLSGQGQLALQPLAIRGRAAVQQPQLLGVLGSSLQAAGWWRDRRFGLDGRWLSPRSGGAVAIRLRGQQGADLWTRFEGRNLQASLLQELLQAWRQWRGAPAPVSGQAADLGAVAISSLQDLGLDAQLTALARARAQLSRQAAASRVAGTERHDPADLQGRLDADLTLVGARPDRLAIDLDARGQLWWRGQGVDQPLSAEPFTVRLQGPLWLGRGGFNVQNIPLALLALLTPVPEGLRGNLTAKGRYGLLRDGPQIDAALSLQQASLRQEPLVLERGQLALNPAGLEVDLALRGGQAAHPVELRGRIPLQATDPGLELRLASRGDGLRFLTALAGPELQWQQGSADLQLLVRGSLAEPLANGFLRLREGVLQLAGQTVRELEATLLFDFRELELQQLTARVGPQGRLEGSGQLALLQPASEVPRLLRLRLHQAPFSLPRLRGQADGELLVAGSLRQPELGGELRLSRGVLNVQPGQLATEAQPDQPRTPRQLLEEGWDFRQPLVVMGQQLESNASRDLRSALPRLGALRFNGLRLRLGPDLRVSVPNVLNFNTAGLLTLNGPFDPSIRASGVVRLLQGRLGLFTTTFSLDPDAPNVAVFTPSLGLIPYLDVALRTRVSDSLPTGTNDRTTLDNWAAATAFSANDQLRLVKVRLQASGPADRLAENLRLSSSPPLPPERLVALIGGNSLVGLVGGNAGAALATVLGQSLLSPVVGGLSDAFGQRLSFALYPTYVAPAEAVPGENQSRRLPSQLVLGSEIGLDVSERFNFSVLAAPNRSDIPPQFTLRYQASDRLGVQTSIDTEGRWQSQLQLFFRF
ncbi:MAG: translocation/assembly module TamB domain-containing protein [Vulcanococcus sp.]